MHLLLPNLLVLALRLAGCQNTSPRQSAQTATPAQPVPDVIPVRNPLSTPPARWQTLQPVTSTSKPFLLLRTDGAAEGNGSCNRFRGKFFTDTPVS